MRQVGADVPAPEDRPMGLSGKAHNGAYSPGPTGWSSPEQSIHQRGWIREECRWYIDDIL